MRYSEYDLKIKLLTDILDKIKVLDVGELYVIHHQLFEKDEEDYDTGFVS
jgi:hypothetical protein